MILIPTKNRKLNDPAGKAGNGPQNPKWICGPFSVKIKEEKTPPFPPDAPYHPPTK